MGDDLFSLLGSAIRQRDEITCVMPDAAITLRPYVLYELREGSFWVAGLHMPQKVPVYIPLTQLLSIKLKGKPFEAERLFNLDDPRYANAVAMIESKSLIPVNILPVA